MALRSALFFGENMEPAKVAVRCWSHARALMQRLEDKVEARDITERFEGKQASNVAGFAIARVHRSRTLSQSYGLSGMDLVHLPQEAGGVHPMSASTNIFQV